MKKSKPNKTTIPWVLTALSIGCGLANWFSFASILLFATGALIAPIDAWQSKLNRWFKKRLLKISLAILLALLAIISSGSAEAPDVTFDETSISTQQNSSLPQHEGDLSITDIDTPAEQIKEDQPNTDQVCSEQNEAIQGDGDQASKPPTKPIESPVPPVSNTTPEPPENSTFSVRFLDVGQADAALIECDGHYMLIDGGNKGDSSLIYSVLKRDSITQLDIVVGTHAHEDHIGGLPGAFNYATADITLCPVTSYDSDAFRDFEKYARQNGNGIVIPSVGDQYTLGSATVTILGVNAANDANNTSIVLSLQYGSTTFLFTGDAEREAEQVILDSNLDLSSTVLKVGHHGSDTSTTYPFLREIMPQYAVISVGKNNSYDHPTDDTLSRLRDADATILRTDLHGDISFISDGQSVTVSTARDATQEEVLFPGGKVPPSQSETPNNDSAPEEQPVGTDYIVNKNTDKFHYPSCSSVKKMKESNKMFYSGTRDELTQQGYSPCGNCNP